MCEPHSAQGVLRDEILAYGKLSDATTAYHGEFTTRDPAISGSHLKMLKDATGSPDDLSCCIFECKEQATVGAHVYFTSDKDAAADVCEIVPTCKTHNNVNRVWNERGTFSQGKGVRLKGGAPFTVRQINPGAMNAKGARGKGGGKGKPAIQVGLYNTVSEFYYNPKKVETLVQSGILLENASDNYKLP